MSAVALRTFLSKAPHMVSAPLALNYAATANGKVDKAVEGLAAPPYLRPIITAHGLMGSTNNFYTVATQFTSQNRTVDGMVALDMRNHGRSPHHPAQSVFANAIDILHFAASMEQHASAVEDPRYILMGHSMGGSGLMTALAIAEDDDMQRVFFDAALAEATTLAERERVELTRDFTKRFHRVVAGAVVVDVCPSDRTPKSFHQIAHDLDALAKLPLSDATDSRAAKEFLKPLIPDDTMRNFLLTNLVWGRSGTPAAWRCNLPVLRRRLPDIMFPFTEPLDKPITTPTLFTFGERSEYNFKEGRDRIDQFFARSEQHVISGAGHYPHYEQRDAFLSVVGPFVDRRLNGQ